MFVELHVISPALGEWPSRSSKVIGNGMAKDEESAWDNHVFACNYHLVIDRLSFINKAINCMQQTWPTQVTKHPASDVHTVGIHHVCHDIGRHVSYGSFLSANPESQRTLSVRYFTTLSQQMLTATKHVADDTFVFSRTAHWHIMHATHSNCRGVNSQLHFF